MSKHGLILNTQQSNRWLNKTNFTTWLHLPSNLKYVWQVSVSAKRILVLFTKKSVSFFSQLCWPALFNPFNCTQPLWIILTKPTWPTLTRIMYHHLLSFRAANAKIQLHISASYFSFNPPDCRYFFLSVWSRMLF